MVVKVQDKDRAAAVVVAQDKAADEVWVVGVAVVWGAEAALWVPQANVSVPTVARRFHISKVYLVLM